MEYAESEYSEYGVIVSDEAKALDAKAGAR
jgi:hypothetical protein